MRASQRRERLLELLEKADGPLSASRLAQTLGVSRQLIVGDVALLRAGQVDILATPKGYLLNPPGHQTSFIGLVAVQHGPEETQEELSVILSHGGAIVDVSIQHPIYGLLTAPLGIQDQTDLAHFLEQLGSADSHLLSSLTAGSHFHTISCDGRETFNRIVSALRDSGWLREE